MKWLVYGYGGSLALLSILGGLSMGGSLVQKLKAILTLEVPTCAYGVCFVAAGLLYGLLRVGWSLVGAWRRWHRPLR